MWSNFRILLFIIHINAIQIEAICKYDEESARLLYQHFYGALVNYSVQIIENQEAAEDIVQDIFEKLWEKQPFFDHIAKLKSYLYNSVRNNSITFLRKKKDNVIDINIAQQAHFGNEYFVDDNGNEDVFTEEVYRQIFLTIDALPARQREIFLLLMEGHKNDEIAEMLSLSVETVRTHRRRAISFLKEHLNETEFILLLAIIPLEM